MAKSLNSLGDTKISLYMPFTSSQKYVCFGCRVCFHRSKHAPAEQKCVNCKNPMTQAGTAFRAPPRRDIKEWAKLEVLIRAGMRFHYCGGNGQIKGLTVNDARQYRKRVRMSTLKDENIGEQNYAIRRPGDGKRVAMKAWYGIDSYCLPN